MVLIEGKYSSFKECWSEYTRNITIGDLLNPIIHKKDPAFGVIKKTMGNDAAWDSRPPELSIKQNEELKQKISFVSSPEIADKILNTINGYTSLEKLTTSEEVGEYRASVTVGYLLDFAGHILHHEEKGWVELTPQFLEKAEGLFEKVGGLSRDELRVGLFNLAGSYEWKRGRYKQSNDFHLRALKIALKKGDPILVARTYNAISTLYGDWKESPETAEEYTKHAIEILTVESLGGNKEAKRILASVYNNLGAKLHKKAECARADKNIEEYKLFLEQSVRTYEESIKHAKEAANQNMIGWASFNVAEVLGYLAPVKGDAEIIEEAKNYAGLAEDIFSTKVISLRGKTGCLMAKGVISMCEGDLYETDIISKARECWEQALAWHNLSVEIRRELEEDRRIADGIVGRAEVYQRLRDMDNCRDDLNEALDIYKRINSEHSIKKVENMIEELVEKSHGS